MRLFVCFLLALAAPSEAQIYADFETSEGPFSIELDYQFSPQAAANFIRLAEGSVSWADPADGTIRVNTPFYDGQTFHEAAPAQLIGFGAPTGSRQDDAGWVFRDDFRSTDFFNFVAFMDNRDEDGRRVPNNNGSRVVITIPQIPAEIQGDFTLLGPVQAATFPIGGSGFDTVLAISQLSAGEVIIESVRIRRVGNRAREFNENAQGLPTVLRAANLRHDRVGNRSYLNWNDEVGTVCRFWESQDLLTWPSRFEDYNHPGKSPLGLNLEPRMRIQPRAFFRGAEVFYPEMPSLERALNLARIQTDFFDVTQGSQTRFQFFFNVAGDGGTWSQPGGGGGVFEVDGFTPVTPFVSELRVSGDLLGRYRLELHYDRNGFTGLTEDVSRLGGENSGLPGTGNELRNGTWIYLSAP